MRLAASVKYSTCKCPNILTTFPSVHTSIQSKSRAIYTMRKGGTWSTVNTITIVLLRVARGANEPIKLINIFFLITGNYSCLKVDLIFTRDRAFYFTTVFIPGMILVTSSFITFWLEVWKYY